MPDEITPPAVDPTHGNADYEMELAEATARGDVAAALDAARPNVELVPLSDERAALLVRRRDTVVDRLDLEQYAGRPARVKGRAVRVTSAAGFINAVQGRLDADAANHAVLYCDEASAALTAVLNDDGPSGPGWRDHRVELHLEHTAEWDHWVSNQGLGEQEKFARTIQLGEKEIAAPSPATMLDLAQTFRATTSATIKQAKRLQDGRTQAVWEEEQQASAGDSGTMEIPETFDLSLRPFYGSELFKLVGRIEWRLSSGKLAIGYNLVRPADVERAAFTKVVEAVTSDLVDLPRIDGTA